MASKGTSIITLIEEALGVAGIDIELSFAETSMLEGLASEGLLMPFLLRGFEAGSDIHKAIVRAEQEKQKEDMKKSLAEGAPLRVSRPRELTDKQKEIINKLGRGIEREHQQRAREGKIPEGERKFGDLPFGASRPVRPRAGRPISAEGELKQRPVIKLPEEDFNSIMDMLRVLVGETGREDFDVFAGLFISSLLSGVPDNPNFDDPEVQEIVRDSIDRGMLVNPDVIQKTKEALREAISEAKSINRILEEEKKAPLSDEPFGDLPEVPEEAAPPDAGEGVPRISRLKKRILQILAGLGITSAAAGTLVEEMLRSNLTPAEIIRRLRDQLRPTGDTIPSTDPIDPNAPTTIDPNAPTTTDPTAPTITDPTKPKPPSIGDPVSKPEPPTIAKREPDVEKTKISTEGVVAKQTEPNDKIPVLERDNTLRPEMEVGGTDLVKEPEEQVVIDEISWRTFDILLEQNPNQADNPLWSAVQAENRLRFSGDTYTLTKERPNKIIPISKTYKKKAQVPFQRYNTRGKFVPAPRMTDIFDGAPFTAPQGAAGFHELVSDAAFDMTRERLEGDIHPNF